VQLEAAAASWVAAISKGIKRLIRPAQKDDFVIDTRTLLGSPKQYIS
jgi:hypothetical protein